MRRGDVPDAEERVYFDLWGANRRALLLAGLRPANIHLSGICTADHVDLFYSHRAEAGAAGRFMGLLGLRET
jgi:copper oxidase (laccase) domain-containing protein